jgi:hypothetical protein
LEKATGSENEWWAKIKPSQNDDWQQFEPDGYTIFSSRDHYASLFKSYSDYEIEAKIPLPLRRGKAVVLYPEYISRICVLPESRSIQREQENFTKLRDKGIALSKRIGKRS